jgi:regulator of nonsense transcripts 1
MPPQIGNFISDSVYDGLLKSNPLHPITADTTACYFVDVPDGKEVFDGSSLKVSMFYGLFAIFIDGLLEHCRS